MDKNEKRTKFGHFFRTSTIAKRSQYRRLNIYLKKSFDNGKSQNQRAHCSNQCLLLMNLENDLMASECERKKRPAKVK